MRTAIAAPAQGRKRERAAVTRENVSFHMLRPKAFWYARPRCRGYAFDDRLYSKLAGCWTIRRSRQSDVPRGVQAVAGWRKSFSRPIAIARDRAASHPFLNALGGRSPMRQAEVLLDRNFAIGRVDPRLFGAFVEHLGRGVYGGLYEPGHRPPTSGGFATTCRPRQGRPTIIKYPGGNFVPRIDGRRRRPVDQRQSG
jgi:hypothetical protein